MPIIALTVRDRSDVEALEGEPEEVDGQSDVEGVFLVSEGSVAFQPVEVGIAGQEYFEVLSGLSVGDSVVAGPYQRIRALRDGDAIQIMDDDGDSADDEGS